MAKVAREMVEKAGVDVDQLVELLVKNAGAELTTYYYYTILRTNLIGLQGETVKEIAEVARVEDRNHFEALVPRIYELGGKLPDDMKTFRRMGVDPLGYRDRMVRVRGIVQWLNGPEIEIGNPKQIELLQ